MLCFVMKLLQEQLHDDRGRVNTLFEKALESGIRIEVGTSFNHEPFMESYFLI